MNRTPMLTRSSNAPYGALSESIIFPPFGHAFPRMRMRFSGLAGKPEAVAAILLRIENQLGAAKQRELAPVFAVGNGRVPDLRGAPQVHGARFAVEPAFLRGIEEIRLELHRGEVLRVRGQVRNASVACERIGEADDRPGVQIAVRREKRLAQLELPLQQAFGHFGDEKPDEAGQKILAEPIEAIDVESGPKRHGFSFLRCRYLILADDLTDHERGQREPFTARKCAGLAAALAALASLARG